MLSTNNPSLYTSLRIDDSETLPMFANLQNKPVSDYGLTLSNSDLQPGNATISPIFDAENFIGLAVNSSGSFSNLKPLPQIPPYNMYILKINPPK